MTEEEMKITEKLRRENESLRRENKRLQNQHFLDLSEIKRLSRTIDILMDHDPV